MPQVEVNIQELITPLYGLKIDVPLIEITGFCDLVKYDDERFAEAREAPSMTLGIVSPDEEGQARASEEVAVRYSPLARYLGSHKPDCLLWARILSPPFFILERTLNRGVVRFDLCPEVFVEASRLWTTLRLYKSGTFRVGLPFLSVMSEPVESDHGWPERLAGARWFFCAPFAPETCQAPSIFVSSGGSYELSKGEAAALGEFSRTAEPVLKRCLRNWAMIPTGDPAPARRVDDARLDVALRYFNRSYEDRETDSSVVDLITSLEALLLQDSQELAYKLAVRTAHLLGSSDEERRKLSNQVRTAYKLRGRAVHGAPGENRPSSQEVEDLRCVVRESILGVMSLANDDVACDLPSVLDDLVLSGTERDRIQAMTRLLRKR